MVKGDITTVSGMDYLNGQPLEGCSATLAQCPYGKPGDRLWVRECYSGPWELTGKPPRDWSHDTPIWYWANGKPTHIDLTRPKPGMHMPRWASRITLEITGVRVERLEDISAADAEAEGLTKLSKDGGRIFKYGIPDRDGLPGDDDDGMPWQDWRISPIDAYMALWDRINGRDAHKANPWVWVLEFKRVTP